MSQVETKADGVLLGCSAGAGCGCAVGMVCGAVFTLFVLYLVVATIMLPNWPH